MGIVIENLMKLSKEKISWRCCETKCTCNVHTFSSEIGKHTAVYGLGHHDHMADFTKLSYLEMRRSIRLKAAHSTDGPRKVIGRLDLEYMELLEFHIL